MRREKGRNNLNFFFVRIKVLFKGILLLNSVQSNLYFKISKTDNIVCTKVTKISSVY